MNVLLIGGTGKISMAISRQLLKEGHTLYLINRGSRNHELDHIADHAPIYLTGDVRREDEMARLLDGLQFDAVADFIAYDRSDLERDYRRSMEKPASFYLSVPRPLTRSRWPITALRKARPWPILTGNIPEKRSKGKII